MKILITDPNAKFFFDEKIRNERTYLGAEDGYNILKAIANNHPENTYYVVQDTENYKELKEQKVFDKIFPYKNVVFYTDELLERYPDVKGRLTKNHRLLNNVKKIVDMNDKLAKEIDAIVCLTVPSEGNITCLSRHKDGSLFTDDDEWNMAFYADYFIHNHPNVPLLAFHVDERFVYQYGKVERTSRVPDLIMGFEDRKIKINTPKYEYPNGMTSKETVDREVQSIYGSNDHISLLNFNVPSHPEWKLGDKENFNKKEKSAYPVKLFYNQLRFGYTEDPDSPFAFVDRLKTFKDFGIFDEFNKDQMQLFTNVPYNDPDIVDAYPDYFNQSLPKNEMIDELAKQKYCLIISNSKKTSMSQKVWECLSIGVIPFMLHMEGVSEYGSNHYINEIWDLVPEFTVVHSAKEMKEKIDYLESHPEDKQKVIDRLMANWNDGFVDGKVVSDAIIENTKKVIKNPVNAFKPFSKKIRRVYIDGPKLSGKTTEINKDIKKHNYKDNEYLIVHSNMKAPNDYLYFSDLLDMNFDRKNTVFDNESVDINDIKYENLKAVYYDRGCISEYVYGEIWEMINLGIIISDQFKLGTLDIDLLKHANIDVNDIKDLCSKDGIEVIVKYILLDKQIDKIVKRTKHERSEKRLNKYELDTLVASNRAFKTMNRLFEVKNFKNYQGIAWKERLED